SLTGSTDLALCRNLLPVPGAFAASTGCFASSPRRSACRPRDRELRSTSSLARPRASHLHDDNLTGGHMSTTTSTSLLAEEHDATRAFFADQLIADGYRVLIAPDRAKALALRRRTPT